jgi:hypothetical protein
VPLDHSRIDVIKIPGEHHERRPVVFKNFTCFARLLREASAHAEGHVLPTDVDHRSF